MTKAFLICVCFSFPVNLRYFITINSTSRSTHLSWRFLHITSPQFVDKVSVFEEGCCYWNITLHVVPRNKHQLCIDHLLIVPRNQLLSVAAACKVLIEFSLLRLENPDEACAVSQVRVAQFCCVFVCFSPWFWLVYYIFFYLFFFRNT